MMFNGLMMYGDSDTSDFTKESIGSSSLGGSAGSDARNRCLEKKLAATMQVLKNKEETVRVQAESLALAEARIAALAARAPLPAPDAPRARRTPPLHSTSSSADGCCGETSDVSVHTQDGDHPTISVLQDNLSVIEDLYRECFYETAKQEELMELLRAACLDVRAAERRKDARIARLQRALSAHCEPRRCQDIALEVENLKSEISNFLNSSNHDSGMWERAEEPPAGELADELHHISGQLLQLRDLLRDGCSCGLEEENRRLKTVNETLEDQLGELRRRVSELEAALEDKENVSQQHQLQLQLKDQELVRSQQRLATLEEATREHRSSCDCLHVQVEQLQVSLQDRTEELSRAQQLCEQHSASVARLRLQLEHAETASRETEAVRGEVSQLSAGVAAWRAQLADGRRRLRALDAELRRERARTAHLDRHYEEKSRVCEELQAQLEETRARGAALCEEAQQAVCGVRRWLRRARDRHREQEQTIEEQDKLIRALQQRQQSDGERSSQPCCERHLRASETASCCRARVSETASCSRARASETAVRARGSGCVSETTSCSRCPSLPRDVRTSTSDVSSLSAPTPPRRSRRKPNEDSEVQWPVRCDASCQRPARADAHTVDSLGAASPEQLLQRVERSHAALDEARRRWRLAP